MYKLAKYLKPYILLILIAIVFLFGQAMADLSLPDYMSRIVNTGIQQGGVENAVPEAIRASRFQKLPMFMTEEERVEVSNCYELIDNSSGDYDKYIKKYPALANEPVYVLKKIDNDEIDKLNPILGKALIALTQMEKMMEEAKAMQTENPMTDADLAQSLGALSPEERANQYKEMNEKFAAMDEKMIVQAAAGSVRAEYEALGMDVDGLRIRYIINIGIMMLLLSLLSAACVIAVGFLSSRIGAGLASKLRRDVFTKVSSFSNAELDRFSTSSLITRTTNDINHVQMLVMMMIRMVFYALIMAVGGVIKAVGKSQSMTWIIAVAVLAILGLILCVFAIALPKFKLIKSLLTG